MKIWRCPRCDIGRKAPSRMNQLDVRRWCLECSAETGKLVEMVCPSLERARAQAKEKQKEKARKKRAKEREAFLLEDGTDMREVIFRAQRLKIWEDEGGAHGARMVRECYVDLVIGEPRGKHGRAWGSRRVHVHLKKTSDPYFSTLLVIHELTHILLSATGLDESAGQGRGKYHGVNFHSILLAASVEWWPELKDVREYITKVYREKGGKDRAYSMDRAIETTLAKLHPDILERRELVAARKAEKEKARLEKWREKIQERKHHADCRHVQSQGAEPCSCK